MSLHARCEDLVGPAGEHLSAFVAPARRRGDRSTSKIAAAACFLPLTTNPELLRSLGSRHRAAIGVTEESDCLTIVVSETAGEIAVALAGRLEPNLSIDQLRHLPTSRPGAVVADPRASTEAPRLPMQTAVGAVETESPSVAAKE